MTMTVAGAFVVSVLRVLLDMAKSLLIFVCADDSLVAVPEGVVH